MRIENPTLAQFRHFSSLFTKLPSTTVEDSLQIRLFMQNKANFRKSQMNVNKVLTKNYENKTLGERGKKQSQSKPIKANLLNAQMNVTVSYTTDYENKPPIRAPKKQSQFSKRQKPMQTFLPKRIMKETRFWVRTKQTQFKPNQTQCLPAICVAGQRQKHLVLWLLFGGRFVKSGRYGIYVVNPLHTKSDIAILKKK